MRTVNRFESNLLQILYCVMGKAPFDSTLQLLLKARPRPKCLSRDTVELVQVAMANGIAQRLATDRGWLTETYLRNSKPVSGRLWERTQPQDLGLKFSKHSLSFLIWMTSTDLSKKTFWRVPKDGQLTLGDKYFFAAVFSTLAKSELGERWSKRKFFFENGLAVLMHAHRFLTAEKMDGIDFKSWVTGQGATILEGMQGVLAANWIEAESRKKLIRSPEQMLQIGQRQSLALTQFMDAADEAGRRDLCRFIFDVLKNILEKRSELKSWTESLNTTGLRIAERTEVKEAAAAVLLQANRLQKWNQESLTSGYLDENYSQMQLWKSDWERLEMQPVIEKAVGICREVSF